MRSVCPEQPAQPRESLTQNQKLRQQTESSYQRYSQKRGILQPAHAPCVFASTHQSVCAWRAFRTFIAGKQTQTGFKANGPENGAVVFCSVPPHQICPVLAETQRPRPTSGILLSSGDASRGRFYQFQNMSRA
jgi:hypothetical protein